MSITTGGGTSHSNVPTGAILDFGHANDPGGAVGDWLECNGQNVSRTTYATLFTKIGTIWGVGDGATTFGLPDRRRRSSVGKGGVGTGTLGNAVGNSGGEETHALSIAELATHPHANTFNDANHSHGQNSSTGNDAQSPAFRGTLGSAVNSPSGGTGDVTRLNTDVSTTGASITNANAGSGTAHNVYHPVVVCGVWIKT